MNNNKKVDRLNAKKMALYNASEFIRSHGEEGGLEEDDFDFPIDVYRKECLKVAKSLMLKGDKIIIKN